MAEDKFPGWHGTTIIGVRRGGEVVVAGDGQVSLGQTVIKGTARKVRRIRPGGHDVVCGFAGSTADAFTLLERLEKKLESAPGQLARACVDLAKDWRMDRRLRRLEALLVRVVEPRRRDPAAGEGRRDVRARRVIHRALEEHGRCQERLGIPRDAHLAARVGAARVVDVVELPVPVLARCLLILATLLTVGTSTLLY